MLLNTDFQRNALSHFKRCPLSSAKIFHWLSRFSPMYLNSLPAKHHLLFVLGYAFGYQELASPAAMLEAPAGCFPQVRISAVPDRMLRSEIRRAWRIPISPGQRGDHAAGQPCWHWALTYSSTAFIYRQINSKDQTQHYSFAISISTRTWSINVSLSCVCQKLCHIWRALRF